MDDQLGGQKYQKDKAINPGYLTQDHASNLRSPLGTVELNYDIIAKQEVRMFMRREVLR
jgi:hypothetical protein